MFGQFCKFLIASIPYNCYIIVLVETWLSSSEQIESGNVLVRMVTKLPRHTWAAIIMNVECADQVINFDVDESLNTVVH